MAESGWIGFDEVFDSSDGGCMYVRRSSDSTVQAAGALWLDGGFDGMHYFACIAEFTLGGDRYGDVVVDEIWDAADAFSDAIDSDIVREIGWFPDMDSAMAAVDDAVAAEGIEQ